MPSGGSALQMVQTLRFNKSLLSNRKSFGELREYLNRKIERRAGLQIPDIDPVELAQIKKEIRIEIRARRKRNKIIWYSLVCIGVIVIALLVFVLRSISFVDENPVDIADFEYQQNIEKRKKQETNEAFSYYIKDGYKWLAENKFHNAVFQFELGVKTRPQSYQANLGLCKAYLKQCWVENENCDQADSMINALNVAFPDSVFMNQTLSYYLMSVGDSNKAMEIIFNGN